MAIQKKIQLYVSDTTGSTKTSKYYRIPLPGETKPANRTDNIYKDLVRFYAKVSGDKFYIGLVIKDAADAIMFGEDYVDTITANLTPSIPDKLMNDGEGLVKFDTSYEYGLGYDKSNFLGDLEGQYSEGSEKYHYWYKNKKKNNLFSECIESDSENDLSEFVPSNWIEFDTIEAVLSDIQTWGEAIPENRGPLYNLYTIDEANLYGGYDFEYIYPQIDIEAGTVTDEYHRIPDAYHVKAYNGTGTITITSDTVTANSKVYVAYYHRGSGHEWAAHMEEITFTDNTAVVNFTNTHNTEYSIGADQAIIMLSHDLIGHVNVTVAKN